MDIKGFFKAVGALLGSAYNLFPLGGANGGIIVRRKGGVAGTNELRLSDDGTKSIIESKETTLYLVSTSGIILRNSTYWGTTGVVASAEGYLTNGIQLRSSNSFAWASGNIGTSIDTGLARTAAAVIAITNGGGGNGWLQVSAGDLVLNANFTNATATMANTNLSWPLVAGRTYAVTGELIVTNSLAADGAKFDFDGGTATVTAMDVAAQNLGTNVAVTTDTQSLAGDLAYSTVTGTNRILLSGFIVCNAAGTCILRGAGNSAASGTMTLARGSWVKFTDMRAV